MNVSLTPELERLVNEKVDSGLYQTASEVVAPRGPDMPYRLSSWAEPDLDEVLIARVLHGRRDQAAAWGAFT